MSALSAGISVGLAAIGLGPRQGTAAEFIVEANADLAHVYRVKKWTARQSSFAFMESLCIYGLRHHGHDIHKKVINLTPLGPVVIGREICKSEKMSSKI